MARDAQGIIWGAASDDQIVETVPLVHNPESPIQPDALVYFRGFATLDGSGVGDTADCRIALPLPGNWVFQMHSWAAHYESSDRGYSRGLLELYVAGQPGGFGNTTQVDYQLIIDQGIDLAQAGTNVCVITPGTGIGGTGSGNSIPLEYASPFRPFAIGGGLGGTDPVIWIGGQSGTNIAGGTIRLGISFARYSLQQFISAGLYTGLSGR